MKLELETNLTPEQVAQAFCELDDDGQAQVFVHAARIAEGWGALREMQWHYVGKHLRECECSTPGGREMVEAIAYGLEPREPQS